MFKLKTSDYIEILKYYNKPIPKINKRNRRIIKIKAENYFQDNYVGVYSFRLFF